MAPRITLHELQSRLEANAELVLVEAMPERYYKKHHLPGAINIPDDQVEELAPDLLPDGNAEIVVYCIDGPCRRSARAAKRLEALGYANVADYAEGKREWIRADLPMDRFRRSRSSSDAADAGAGAARMREAA